MCLLGPGKHRVIAFAIYLFDLHIALVHFALRASPKHIVMKFFSLDRHVVMLSIVLAILFAGLSQCAVSVNVIR